MKLSTGTGADVVAPSSDQVVEAIRSLPGGDDSFVVLSRSEDQFLQTLGSAQEGFRLEYKDLTGGHFVATDEKVTEDQLIQMFLAYLRGDDSWKLESQWTELSEARGCGGAALSALLVTVLLALAISGS